MTSIERTWIKEGKEAYEAGTPSQECPYVRGGTKWERWQHGWWKAMYAQRDLDGKRIAYWLEYYAPPQLNMNDVRAQSIAHLITMLGTFDRTQPIANNRLGGVEFDIPAPSTLPDPPNLAEGN